MIAPDVMERAAVKRHATIQSLNFLRPYPVLLEWLNNCLDNPDHFPCEAFDAPSRLTSKGLPVEYAIVWPSYSVRCTMDVMPHGTAKNRIAKTLQFAGPITDAFQREICQNLIESQNDIALRYGAWLGLREEDGNVALKIYLEIADNLKNSLFEALSISTGLLAGFGVKPVMTGLPITKGGIEIYFRLARMDRAFMKWLLSYFKFPDRTNDIFKMLEDLCESRFESSLNWSSLGFSFTWSQDLMPESITFYSFANSAIGSDEKVRKQVLRLGEKNNWDMGLYDRLSKDATGTTDLNTFHGMVGVVAGVKGKVHFTVGISPFSPELL